VEAIDNNLCPYWDFGTKERYLLSLLQLCTHQKTSTHPMEEVLYGLVEGKWIDNKKLFLKCGELKCVVNLNGEAQIFYRDREDQVTVELISNFLSLIASTGQSSTHK
jgi:hypothetical protein